MCRPPTVWPSVQEVKAEEDGHEAGEAAAEDAVEERAAAVEEVGALEAMARADARGCIPTKKVKEEMLSSPVGSDHR